MFSVNPTHTACIRDRACTADYAKQALEAIVTVSQAGSPPELLERLVRINEAIGATASVFISQIPEDGDEPSCFSVFACDPAFAQEQSRRGPLIQHPWFRFARTHTVPGTNEQIAAERITDAEAFDLAHQYGFRSCLVVPTQAGVDLARVEMLCLGSQRCDDFEGEQARLIRALARSLAAELHEWLSGYLRRRLIEHTRLHDPDIALLAMEWSGLSTKDISQRTGLTSASVDCRFQRINARLNCASRRAAARRAAAYGLLE